jgi:hypothetical protein
VEFSVIQNIFIVDHSFPLCEKLSSAASKSWRLARDIHSNSASFGLQVEIFVVLTYKQRRLEIVKVFTGPTWKFYRSSIFIVKYKWTKIDIISNENDNSLYSLLYNAFTHFKILPFISSCIFICFYSLN